MRVIETHCSVDISEGLARMATAGEVNGEVTFSMRVEDVEPLWRKTGN